MNHKTLFHLAAAMMLLGKLSIPFGTRLTLQKTSEPEMVPDAPPQEKIPAKHLNTGRPLRKRPAHPVIYRQVSG
jgi:hypothetical protein